MEVNDRQHLDGVRMDGEKNAVRKPSKKRAANVASHDGKLQWRFPNSRNDSIE